MRGEAPLGWHKLLRWSGEERQKEVQAFLKLHGFTAVSGRMAWADRDGRPRMETDVAHARCQRLLMDDSCTAQTRVLIFCFGVLKLDLLDAVPCVPLRSLAVGMVG